MGNLDFEKMQELQKRLQERYKDWWGGLSPQKAKNQLLWMLVEAGEAADIIKKRGDDKIMKDAEVRAHFVEEMCDVMMYFNEVLLCYDITPQEFETAYLKKHEKNMTRWK